MQVGDRGPEDGWILSVGEITDEDDGTVMNMRSL
jgi:hypothetical protein